MSKIDFFKIKSSQKILPPYISKLPGDTTAKQEEE